MIESRLISLLRRSKSVTQKFSSSNPRNGKRLPLLVGSQMSTNQDFTLRCRDLFQLQARRWREAALAMWLKFAKHSWLPVIHSFVSRLTFFSKSLFVVLGGVTRLTRSGLSMTDWKFTGGLPPLSDEEWLVEFEKYKQSLEYKRVNKGMSLDDFKFIYWMEYAHRMWGRALGIMFALPFSYFLRKGYITVQLGLRLCGIFALGAGQGLIGWWMVKSGLEEPASEYAEPRVSPYRLAAHLTSAFVIYSGLFWTALSVVMPEPPAESVAWVQGASKVKRLALPVSFLVGITAVSGAFVAGNDAGRAFNTFPKMGDTWIPEDVFSLKPLVRNFFENTSTVQLDHRILATATLFAIGGLWWSSRKLDIHPAIRSLIGSTMGMAALQVTLGISTLLSYVPVSLGTAHQAGALTLLTLMILLNHTLRRPSLQLLKTLPSVVKNT
ncbi:UNVERIFIED_CONTAM: Cytochrome c oxidase assembly protein COX15 [Sesamum latifolium]|uniref:Cytochrome c oxidase assembly protein COX15 n=1 Tax=Sesamum latifolium TaxID=2727402 RepID=A0AAW2VEP9_9LAMI